MTKHQPAPGDAAGYEIRIQGQLDERRAAWFGRLDITGRPDGTSVITTPAIDQAALHGLLRLVRDAGIRLVSVTQIDPVADGDQTEGDLR